MRKKSIKRVLATLMLFFISVSQVYAGDYYSKLSVTISGSGGKVKLARNQSDLADYSQYVTTGPNLDVKTSAGATEYFWIGAAPTSRGYKFTGWSNLSNCSITSGSTSSPQIQVSVKAPASSGWVYLMDLRTSASIKANFAADTEVLQAKYESTPNGSYTVTGPDGYGTVTVGNGSTYTTYSGDMITLSATPNPGTTFIRYYTVDESGNITTLGELYKPTQTVNIIGSGTVSVCADITDQPFAIGARTFATLDAALQAVKTTSLKTILLISDAVVDPGQYTIPSGVTLLIPRDASQTTPMTSLERTNVTTAATGAYRKLTLSTGANIQVYGTIELGGKQAAGAQGATGAGIPTGTYGQMDLQTGSKITLNSEAKLYAWGFVTGSGDIDARRGSKVYEQFQIYDWKGGKFASAMINNSQKVFPISQYYIQNVEAPTTYHPGAELISVTSINVSNVIIACNTIKIIGSLNSGAMFLMDEADLSDNTWVCKKYDPATDQQVYDVNSSASLGSMVISFDMSVFDWATRLILQVAGISDELDFDSRDYVLPVTNNLKIHLLTGEMGITQSTVMLPGSEIEIDKTSTVTINSNQTLYVYDSEDWQPYVMGGKYAIPVRHSPSASKDESHGNLQVPVARPGTWAKSSGVWWYSLNKPEDAKINVHGTFDCKGNLYTTGTTATVGANIFSSVSDAGTIQFTNSAGNGGNVYQWHQTSGEASEYVSATCTAAKLKNEIADPLYSPTAGTTAGQSFCYLDLDGTGGRWTMLVTDGCFVYDAVSDKYYAKPSDYVALKNGKTENADHTYSSADDTRLFILYGDCQWWEVTYHEQSGLYYCDKNGIYYYYDDSDPRPEYQEWKEKRCVITWQDWDGTEILSYDLPYGATPEYLGSFPTRPDDVGYYTYDFTAWAPAFAPVTADVTYVAQYERNPVMYTITWQNANGTEREVDYFQRDEMPVCRTQPADMSALEWRPAVAAVTGNATYRLYPKDNVGPYDIKFVNWNGAQIGATQSVAKGNMPNVPADPTKPALDDVEFIFAGWSPEVVAATAAATYTATFTEQPITYTILWKNYDDATLETDENVAPNAVPQYNGATPTKPSDATFHYTFSGWNPEVVAATEDATYTAQFAATPKDKIVANAETIEEGKQQTVTNLTIGATGKLVIPSTSRVNATNLYLEANESSSGQLITNANTSINITGSAYFDWTMNGIDGTQYRTWYAVAVPWEVNAETGILDKATGRTLVAGRDFDLIYYSGADRATNGNVASNWQYVQWDIQGHDKQGNPRPVDNLLHPGRLYMMYFAAEGLQTVRFEKAAGADVMYMSPLNVSEYSAATGDDKDANWNGIANPRTYFASFSAGSATYAQVLNNGNLDDYFAGESSPVYQTINLASSKFMVGKPVFLQATGNDPLVVTRESTAGIVNAAPRRNREVGAAPEGIEAVYHLTIAADGKPSSDNLYVQVSEDEKADKYVIGQDLAKGGVAAKRAQMWVDRYNTKLSVNTQMLVNDEATYPLVLFAPTAGDYTISNIQSTMSNEDYDLYLTKDGRAIWNLTMGACTLDLPQGTATNYGLRIRKAPQTATGIEEAVVDAQGETKKVLINDQVYIIRGNNVYSVDGQLVR